MIDEAPKNKIKEGLNRSVWGHQSADFQEMVAVDGEKVQKMEIASDCFQTIKVQLRAIGLITKAPESAVSKILELTGRSLHTVTH